MNRWIGFRIGVVYLSLVCFLSLIGFRLIQLQVIRNPTLEELATRQFQKVSKTSPFRLPIYDRNEEELAVSIPMSSIFARPKLITRKRYTAKILAKVMGGPNTKWLSKLKADRSFIWIERQAKEEIARELARYRLPGIFVEAENKRIYPNGNLASHVIGFTDIDGNGLAGAELSFNDDLLQRSTEFRMPRDGRGNPSYIDPSKPAVEPGRAGISLTLDRRVQHIVEDELDISLMLTGSRAAMAIVMDPRNGEVIAMGQRPSFDPNRASDSDPQSLTNRTVSHLFEPGSTLKTFFIGEALQLGLLDETTSIDCENGEFRVGDRIIHEAESEHRFSRLSVADVLAFSSNIGAVKIAQYLGSERVREVLDKYGFTEKTGVRLPGEASSTAKEDAFWKPVQLANVAFGQGISINPLQLVAAYAPIANGGYRVRPKIVLGEQPSKTRSYQEGQRVLSPNTVATLRSLLVSVVEKKGGTGNNAAMPGFRVAGKTGTAQKYIAGLGYGGSKYFSTFIGFLPAEKPELLISVMVDEPHWPFYASQVAAPLFKKIAERSMQVLGKMPKTLVANASPFGSPEKIATTIPPSRESVNGKMPNFAGKAMRDVLATAEGYFKHIRIVGSGYLVSQSPTPGSEVSANFPITLVFSPEG
ncbi:MAG: transpeptidase family protein [Deltaproteobacteria bacterium]|nr:transpeptidase family protein [Deltaproteobacteria bacterium]MBI3295508.1 transpeptidase family protein [Deltaproteobacteria bacterium]